LRQRLHEKWWKSELKYLMATLELKKSE